LPCLYPNQNIAAGANAGPVLLILMVYLGAISGFLVYNFNPASAIPDAFLVSKINYHVLLLSDFTGVQR